MKIGDMESKLDRRLVLSMKQDSELVNASRNFNSPIPVSVFGDGDKMYMDAFLPKNMAMDQHLKLMIQKLEIRDRKESYVIRSRINNVKSLKLISKLFEANSVVPNRIDIEGGQMHYYMRFHHNFQDEISDLLAQYIEDPEVTQIKYLGPSDGLNATISRINSQYPVTLVSYDSQLDAETRKSLGHITEGSIAEMKNTGGMDNGFSGLLYTEDKVSDTNPSVKKLVGLDNIYKVNVKNDFLGAIRRRVIEVPIVRLSIILRILGNRINITAVVPSIQVNEYCQYIFEAAKETKSSVSLKALVPYTPENFLSI